jgi:hypothetical protein
VSTPLDALVDLPPAAAGQNVQFRWRVGTNSSGSGTGWTIDRVKLFSTTFRCGTSDSDGDGMPDGWETQHGLDPQNATDANADSDGDGFSNLQEYVAGTDPTSSANALRVTVVNRDASSGAFVLTFPTVNGRVYRAEWTENLTGTISWTVLGDEITGTGSQAQVTDAAAGARPGRFYRVRVVR